MAALGFPIMTGGSLSFVKSFLVLLLIGSSALAGDNSADAAKKRAANFPKEVEPPLKIYRSDTLRTQVIEHVEKIRMDSSVSIIKQAESIHFLLDLRNDDISVCVLVPRPGQDFPVNEPSFYVLQQRPLTPADAVFLGRAAMMIVPTGVIKGGEQTSAREGAVRQLGQFFCKSLGLPFVEPKTYERKYVKEWLLGVVKQADRKTSNQETRLRLELLKLQIGRL